MEKIKGIVYLILAVYLLLFSVTVNAYAHFGLLIPSDDIVTNTDSKVLTLDLKFLHPLEGNYMDLVKPNKFGVMHKGRIIDLLGSLKESKGRGGEQKRYFKTWQAEYKIKRHGVYQFYMEPKPYWEPSEDVFIIHYTKVVVSAFGDEEGWGEPLGLETEIVPLSRPFGVWKGNIFTGKVLLDGKPVPGAEVEVEFFNESPGIKSKVKPPSDPYITQVIKADDNGVFSYAMPKAGWWGFAALNTASRTMKFEGKEKNIELGAVYWIKTIDIE